MSKSDVIFDFDRPSRIGLPEAVFCEGKTAGQIAATLEIVQERGDGVLLTRLDRDKLGQLPEGLSSALDYCELSRTAFFGPLVPVAQKNMVAIVAAGTSDAPVAQEAARTLRHAGVEARRFTDVGVAGLWRLTERVAEIRDYPVVIAVAGMDAALVSVLGGLVPGALICVPTSVGYGAAENGRTALNSILASCAPGVTACNIDNGYGAAAAAMRIINAMNVAS